VDDDPWTLIESLLPAWPVRSLVPQPVPDRFCRQGILFVLHNEIAWHCCRWNWDSAPGRSVGGGWTATGPPRSTGGKRAASTI